MLQLFSPPQSVTVYIQVPLQKMQEKTSHQTLQWLINQSYHIWEEEHSWQECWQEECVWQHCLTTHTHTTGEFITPTSCSEAQSSPISTTWHVGVATVEVETESRQLISISVLIVPSIAALIQNLVSTFVYNMPHLRNLKLAHSVSSEKKWTILLLIGTDHHWSFVEDDIMKPPLLRSLNWGTCSLDPCQPWCLTLPHLLFFKSPQWSPMNQMKQI